VLGVARPLSFVPDWLLFWRPQWILLALVFWVLHLGVFRGVLFRALFTPGRSDDGTLFRRGMTAVWLSGFVIDGLLAEPLGLNGAIFATIAFYLMRFQDRLALQTLVQRMVMIFLMVFLAEVFRAFVLNLLNGQPWVLQPLTVALTSMLVWPIYHRLSERASSGVRS
jgi:rod shape-determining protein MreD